MPQRHPLPRGITGFISHSNSLRTQEVKPFISLLYSILKGTMEWEDLDLSGKNYYYFSINSNDQEFNVLLNAHSPYVAISRRIEDNKFIFMNSEEINEQFKLLEECNYFLLGNEVLVQELTKSDLTELDSVEIQQVNYWKPKNIREIVFNNWD